MTDAHPLTMPPTETAESQLRCAQTGQTWHMGHGSGITCDEEFTPLETPQRRAKRGREKVITPSTSSSQNKSSISQTRRGGVTAPQLAHELVARGLSPATLRLWCADHCHPCQAARAGSERWRRLAGSSPEPHPSRRALPRVGCRPSCGTRAPPGSAALRGGRPGPPPAILPHSLCQELSGKLLRRDRLAAQIREHVLVLQLFVTKRLRE